MDPRTRSAVFPTVRGPAIIYVPTPDDVALGTEEMVLYRVDTAMPIQEGGTLSADTARRERAVLRSLLEHALTLLNESEAGA